MPLDPDARPRLLRRIALGYAVILAIVAGLNYLPGLRDAQGRVLGIFALDLFDDLLHLASAVWAGLASLSFGASVLFLRVFGALYFTDGLMGLLVGSGYLDFGIFIYGIQPLPFAFKLAANTPHLLLGGIALYSGFVLARRAP